MLKDGRLFYFKTWEDYGSGGKATNLKEPIEMQRSMLTLGGPSGERRSPPASPLPVLAREKP